MTKFVYAAYDKVANDVLCVFCSQNDGLAIRENLPALSKVLPIGDIELRRIGTVDGESALLHSLGKYTVVDWNSYKFPESPLKKTEKEVKKDER